MLHVPFATPASANSENSVVQLPGRRLGVLDAPADTPAIELLAEDHPVLLLLDEVERLRAELEDSEVELANTRGDLAQAYDRECDLVRILHRYVIAEQSAQERRRWWASMGRGSRS